MAIGDPNTPPNYVNPFIPYVAPKTPTKQQSNAEQAAALIVNPTIKPTPKQFLTNYMVSKIYAQRLNGMGMTQKPDISKVQNIPIVYKNGQQTGYEEYPNGKIDINIDKKQISGLKNTFGRTDSTDDITTHELSHVSRPLSPKEQEFIGSKNISTVGEPLFGMWKTDRDIHGSTVNYNNYMNPQKDGGDDQYHDFRPYENKADLDALRYMMLKNNIYDTSKRDMTIDDFNKALKTPEIKNSLMFNRLIQQFKPADIINMNNKIAMNTSDNSDKNLT